MGRWQQFCDWWGRHVQSTLDVEADVTAAFLAAAFAAGAFIAVLHALFRSKDPNRSVGLGTTLILLCFIVALVTHVIGSNFARGFGLVGALSIIRFRTPVSDTRDTTFVIFAVAVGMAVGAGYMRSALVALPCFAIGCGLIRVFGRAPSLPGELKMRLDPGVNADALLRELNGKSVVRYRLMRSASRVKSPAVELTYRVWLARTADAAGLVDSLRRKPGVQKVAWTSR